jgi:serine/threonine protein kinase
LTEKISSAMIPLHLIKTITDEFAEKNRLGKGGYGEVYKGVLNGQEIAVKKLFPVHGLDEEAFTNELRNLMKVQHKNILRLIGYSYEISHQHINHDRQFVFSKVIDRALCFEFMDKGSLSQHLSAESCIHDWPTTFKIIKGTSEGIDYLHRGRRENNFIYHLELKPDKILMDKNMVPKIKVFGSSRLFNDSQTHRTTTAKGTM